MYFKAVEARREYSRSTGGCDCPESLPSTFQAVRLPCLAYEHILSFTDDAAHEAVPNYDDSRLTNREGVAASDKLETHEISFLQNAVVRGVYHNKRRNVSQLSTCVARDCTTTTHIAYPPKDM